MKTTAALVTVPLLVLALGGCTLLGGGGGGGGSEDPSGDGSTGGESLAGGVGDCLFDREWILDTADAAEQLGEMLRSNGLSVVSSTGSGSQTIWFDHEGYAGSATNLTYTIVANLDSGMVMTMAQSHVGDPGGEWAWVDESQTAVTFTAWSRGYTVTTDTSINGTAAPTSTMAAGGLGGLEGQSMTVSCEGGSLTTQMEGNPFIMHWVSGESL